MQNVLNTLERMSDLETVQVQSISESELHVLVKSWRLTTNGEIDEDLLRVSIRDALGLSRNRTPQSETYQIETYQDGEEWANVYISKKSHKET